VIGRLSDHYDKLLVLSGISVIAVVTVFMVTRLKPGPLIITLTTTTLLFVCMSGRFAPTMAMIANAVEARYRGGFMSVNSAIQQLASGLANLTAGLLVTSDADGHLIGYPNVGYLSLTAFIGTVFLAWWLRAAVPHAAKPARLRPLAPEREATVTLAD
jgi:predicted MFS family arabinose efflux permease